MDPITIALITIGLLMLAIILGVHIGIALAAVSAVGLWWITGEINIAIKLMGAASYRAVNEYIFGVVPMFILMGMMANLSGASRELYDAANVMLARVRGGLGIATVLANAVFAAITGVSVASAAIFSTIALPQMMRLGYDKKFALGTVAGSSLLGMLIPPSLLLIIYGVITEESIGALFIAGVVPGILLALLLCLLIAFMVWWRPQLAGERPTMEKMGRRQFFRILCKPWMFLLLIVVIFGGMYLGFFTPTEAGAIGAFGTFLVALFKGKVTVRKMWDTLLEAGYITASIMFLFIAAAMYARMLTISGLPAEASAWITALPIPSLVIVALFLLLFLMLGAFLDSISIMLVCIPLMFPVVQAAHFDPIWFGIVSVVALEMGFITPPFGMVAFTIKAAIKEEATIEEIFLGSLPFLVINLVALVILFLFPKISTWLPALM
jgi:tripartite ATP-independent transporter DctM subunit